MQNNTKNSVLNMTMAALLCAIGIAIPMFSPIKVILEPASFTLASHVPIFIAMFLSPATAAFVAIGTTLGFFFGGFPIAIVLRAATHLIFALCGSLYIARRPAILDSKISSTVFSFILALVHAACEVAVVTPLFLGNAMSDSYYSTGYVTAVLLLVGVGSVVHSMVDFVLAQILWRLYKRANHN